MPWTSPIPPFLSPGVLRRGSSSLCGLRYTCAVHRIVIVGGGFGGIAAARGLAKRRLADVEITLVTPHPWIEYYGVLYRLLNGGRISQACIPLALVLSSDVRVVIDRASSVDAASKTVLGEKGSYQYDTLVLAPGSVPAYFGIPGMDEHAFSMSDVHQTLRLANDVRRDVAALRTATGDERQRLGRFIVIGAGPTGIEISGEIMPYARALARKHGVDPTLVRVDLIEAADRLLPRIEPAASARVAKRLRSLGVSVMLNTTVASASPGSIQLKDGTVLRASSIIWTAGAKANGLLATVAGVELDKRGRAVVDEQLRAKGVAGIHVLGDCAVTPYSGMAQTAFADGVFVAGVIAAALSSKSLPAYTSSEPAYAIPVGPRWAEVKFFFIHASGLFGYVLRRAADIHVYMLIMPWRHVVAAFFGFIRLRRYGISVP